MIGQGRITFIEITQIRYNNNIKYRNKTKVRIGNVVWVAYVYVEYF